MPDSVQTVEPQNLLVYVKHSRQNLYEFGQKFEFNIPYLRLHQTVSSSRKFVQ